MRSSLSLLISLLAVLPAASVAAPPNRVQVAYEVMREGTRLADIVDELQHGDGRYRFVETWKGRGIYALGGNIVRTSRGTLAAAGPRPDEFTDERSGRATERAVFDWASGRLTMQRKGATQYAAIPPNAQDRLSFLLALSFARPLKGQIATYSVADGDSISSYAFEVLGIERIKVPAGEFDAVKLVRRKDGPEDKRATEMWLAPALGFLPVRIVVVDRNGTRLDQQATRISIL